MASVTRWRKRPIVIEAIQYTPATEHAVTDWMRENRSTPTAASDGLIIETLEGAMKASSGDWIIRGVTGEFYPCKPDVFAATYSQEP